MAGLVFFTWGEIFSLFPATCTDTYGSQYATTNAGLLSQGDFGLGGSARQPAQELHRNLALGVRHRHDHEPCSGGVGAVRAQAVAASGHGSLLSGQLRVGELKNRQRLLRKPNEEGGGASAATGLRESRQRKSSRRTRSLPSATARKRRSGQTARRMRRYRRSARRSSPRAGAVSSSQRHLPPAR